MVPEEVPRGVTSASYQGASTTTQTAGSRRLEVTPAVTRSKASQGNLQTMLSDSTLRGMQKLALHTKEAMPDIAHYMEMRTHAEYAYATTSMQLKSPSEGEKVVAMPNTCREVMGLPEAGFWKATSDKEMASLDQPYVCNLVPLTPIPAGQKSAGSRWVDKNQARQDLHRKACFSRLGTGRRSRLWRYVHPCLQNSKHPNGARIGSGVRSGYPTAGRPKSVSKR